MTSGLTGLSIGIAQVACGLAIRFVLQDTLGTGLVRQFARLELGSGSGSNGGLPGGFFGGSTILLVKSCLLALGPTLLTRFRDQKPLCLPDLAMRFGRLPGGVEGLDESCLGMCRSAAAFGMCVVRSSFQISIQFEG